MRLAPTGSNTGTVPVTDSGGLTGVRDATVNVAGSKVEACSTRT
jgi:hypothetical protein